ncbi:beta-N-acetylhexosaminidase [Bythopirellula polymerisocia]|uniref:beta-N-acetylhexosaminidase n=1 Tax=Bythopirellula polymerisocia TaxID=2528003 RepID=A0A5C6CD65_9BACT|nr:beta-N-acetylhexosaminidase [Bythopirellula polymerisocia]TWU20749.1 Beta-hexosaminidase [Bythopirellula polymerisocia]
MNVALNSSFTVAVVAFIGGIYMSLTAEQTRSESLPIIPKPVQQNRQAGAFLFTDKTPILYGGNLDSEAHLLAESIKQITQLSLPVCPLTETNLPQDMTRSIRLAIVEDYTLGSEGYHLKVSAATITITGNDAAGVYWGSQSLRQILMSGDASKLPACEIVDQPRFGWRGMLLDVGRHLFATNDIKQLLDWMALHKLNVLHWHLTDDQGWRIEIDKYPKLTEIGAWRTSSPPYGDRLGTDGTHYGGFYSQDEIRDLVQYAADRHITIVPEIDMPGHMVAAIAAYPEIGNDDIPDYSPEVSASWGTKSYILSPKEETFNWIDDVLAEVCELFPSTYIHIGGDEAPKDQWKESAFAQSVIQREGLQDEHELQSWFIRRVEGLLERRGRKLIGWDEIRDGGLSPGATVMAWQTWEAAVDSAREGHDVVMAPKSHSYFDYYQASPAFELAKGLEYETIGGYLPLAKVYDFDPVPSELMGTDLEHHILGCQGQIWTEYIKTWDKLEYMVFPRLSALAESAWSPPQQKDYADFLQRLRPMLANYKAARVTFYNPFEEFSQKTRWHASVETTLPRYIGSLPEFAFDGDWQTYFWADRSPEPGDHFTVTFKSAIRGASIKVFTGSSRFGSRQKIWGGEKDALQQGVLEASADGVDWHEIATFDNGTAVGKLPEGCKSIRIRPTDKQTSPRLVIHEIQIGDE